MTAVAVAIILLQLLGMCATISLVGKPREPLTPGVAVATVLTALGVIALGVGVAYLIVWMEGRR